MWSGQKPKDRRVQRRVERLRVLLACVVTSVLVSANNRPIIDMEKEPGIGIPGSFQVLVVSFKDEVPIADT